MSLSVSPCHAHSFVFCPKLTCYVLPFWGVIKILNALARRHAVSTVPGLGMCTGDRAGGLHVECSVTPWGNHGGLVSPLILQAVLMCAFPSFAPSLYFPPVTLPIMSLRVVTTVGKARGLSFSEPFPMCDMMTAVVGMETDRAIFQGPSNEGAVVAVT